MEIETKQNESEDFNSDLEFLTFRTLIFPLEIVRHGRNFNSLSFNLETGEICAFVVCGLVEALLWDEGVLRIDIIFPMEIETRQNESEDFQSDFESLILRTLIFPLGIRLCSTPTSLVLPWVTWIT